MEIDSFTSGDLVPDDLGRLCRRRGGVFPVTAAEGEVDFIEGVLGQLGRIILTDLSTDVGTAESYEMNATLGTVATALFRWRFLGSREDGVMPFAEAFARAKENDPANGWYVKFDPSLDKPVVFICYEGHGVEEKRRVDISVSPIEGCEGVVTISDAGITYPDCDSTVVEFDPNDPLLNKPLDLEEGSSVFAGRIHEILEDLRPLSIPVGGDRGVELAGGPFPAVPDRCFRDVQEFFAWLKSNS
jgi:hypothetical protein